MHSRLVEAVLEHEIEIVGGDPQLKERHAAIWREERAILVRPSRITADQLLLFGGGNYDAEPLSLTVVDATTRASVPGPEWPGNLYFGEHPSLKRPFACIRGLYEYHTHFSHLEPWDRCRYSLRFPLLLSHVLSKSGL